MKHVAIIPARKDSKGFPGKNRIFFDQTADFLDEYNWFERIIVSTNDNVIVEKAQQRQYEVHPRSTELSGDAVSIKQVMESVIKDCQISDDYYIWLFYLPMIYKNIGDFQEARDIVELKHKKSLCGFVPAKTHPYLCWSFDEVKEKLKQYIENDVFRRQDLSAAWMPHHYLYCCLASELAHLNSELLNANTFPFFLGDKTINHLVEIDTPEDLEKWKNIEEKVG